ncbi:MAG: hypothetical protein ACYCSQ_00365 [bacterium]
MDAKKINSICLALLNKGVRKLKEELEYLNEDGSLDVYQTVDVIFADVENCSSEKLQFFYDKLKEFYGKKEAENKYLSIAA